MSRYREKSKKEDRNGKIILAICASLGLALLVLKQYFSKQEGCEKNSYQLSILIDDTDPLNQIVIKRIKEDIGNIKEKFQDENIQLNLFKVSKASTPNNKPETVCLPKVCSQIDYFLRGCKTRDDAAHEFDKIINGTMNESLSNHSVFSPIAESITNIQGGLFLNSSSSKHSSLYIYSDLLQNSPTTDFYHGNFEFNFSKTPRPNLDTDQVHICVLQRPNDMHIQNRILPAWKQFFGNTRVVWDGRCKMVVD